MFKDHNLQVGDTAYIAEGKPERRRCTVVHPFQSQINPSSHRVFSIQQSNLRRSEQHPSFVTWYLDHMKIVLVWNRDTRQLVDTDHLHYFSTLTELNHHWNISKLFDGEL